MSKSDIVNAFNASINARELASLAARMTEDHVFIDTAGAQVAGKAACLAAWRGFFEAFPDYENVFSEVHDRGDVVVVEGYSLCADARLAGPVIWTAVISGEGVREWRVWEDTPATRQTVGLR